jgi:hypothetical protein
MTIRVFYHNQDLDGYCSGAIVKYRFPEAVMYPINYGDEFPWGEIAEDDEVFMVDFCLQPEHQMLKLYEVLRSDEEKEHDRDGNLCWIDHHVSAIKAMEDIGCYPYGRTGVSKAACELTWEYLFPNRPVPLAVKLLSLYDSWTYHGHELEDMVLPFQMRMRMEDLDPKDWDSSGKWWYSFFYISHLEYSWVGKSMTNFIEEGRLLLRYDEANKAKYVKTYAFETILQVPKPEDKTLKVRPEYSAIAVNLGDTDSKVFDSVWRRKCYCEGEPVLSVRSDTRESKMEPCPVCKGTGYIEPYDLMIPFVRRPDKLWDVSLYSTKPDVDCGAIAKSFGGGGHLGAAGFQRKELPFEY